MKKIMIVEDDPDICRALSFRLSASGFEIVTASDAILAMTVAQRERPDLAILDINMPGGDGFKVATRMQDNANLGAIPVIFITASKRPEHIQEAERIGAIGYFEKPFDSNLILQYINTALGVSPMHPGQSAA